MAARAQSAHSVRSAFDQCIVSLSDVNRHGLKGVTDEELDSLGAALSRTAARLTAERVARAPERYGNRPIASPRHTFHPPEFNE